MGFRPKEVLRAARENEKKGRKREASAQYASLSAFLRRRSRWDQAKKLVDKAISLSPDSPRLYLQRALCEWGLGKEAQAHLSVQSFARRVLRRQKGEEYRPYLEEQLKSHPALRQIFYEAQLEIDRTDAAPFLSLALAYKGQGNLKAAQKTLLDALKTRSRHSDVLCLLAEILQERGRIESIAHLKRYQSGNLTLPDLILLIADVSPAPRGERSALASQTGGEKNLQTLIRELELEMGLDLEEGMDRVNQLVHEFRRKSDKVLSNDTKTRIDLSLAFFEMGLTEDARDELRPIPATDPRFLEAQCALGEILLGEGSDLGALEAFQTCLRDERASEEIQLEARYKIVQIYFRLGDYRQALWHALELEGKAPNYRNLRHIKLQIQEAAAEPDGSGDPERGAARGMRGAFLKFLLALGGLYVVLQLILGSSPVQKRVLAEIRAALSKFGLDLKIESIEFSALTPKIYLNRVTLTATRGSAVPLPEPVTIDKIKIEFQPLALISRRIVFQEVTLFHPRLVVPSAERLYRRALKLLNGKRRPEIYSGGFALVVKRFGVVDALFKIVSHDPPVSARSRSFSVFLENTIRKEQTLTVQSGDLEIERGPLRLHLTRTDIDADMTDKGIRVNRAIIEGDHLSIDLKATCSLPFRERRPDSLSASYDIHLPLKLLERVPELKLPSIAGSVDSSGTMDLSSGQLSSAGKIRYEGVAIQGYQIGGGSLFFDLADKHLSVTEVNLRYADGDVRSRKLLLDLGNSRIPVSGELALDRIRLEGLLKSLKAGDVPLRMGASGSLKVSGSLRGPMELNGNLKAKISRFTVLKNHKKEATDGNTVLVANEGSIDGTLRFTEDKVGFQAAIGILGGNGKAEGFIGFDNTAKIHAQGAGLSLTDLRRISSLRLGGKANVTTDIDVHGKDVKLVGSFDVTHGEIADVLLGQVKGEAYFRDALLSFEKIELNALEPIRGNGFVDFRPKKTRYHFVADTRRAGVNQVFGALGRLKLGFGIPKGGEVGAHLIIDGEDEELTIAAGGTAKNFRWHGEKWMSSGFNFTYRPEAIDLSQLTLLKRSGGLELRGHFASAASRLHFLSHGLKLEEFDAIGKAPITGELVGELNLQGDLAKGPIQGSGEVRLSKVTYRGNPLPDSVLSMKTQSSQLQVLANFVGRKLRGRYVTPLKGDGPGELLLYFQDFDFSPFAAAWMGKDLPTLTDITATGDLSLKGSFSDWPSLEGSGSVTSLLLGFRGTPMRNKQPLELGVEHGMVRVSRFNLVGQESQVSLDFLYQPGKNISASLDGKLDLQFLQPFIPGLEYGTGQVTVGLRISGPSRNYELLGNLSIDDGAFRLTGLSDEFRSTQAQISVSQDRINIDRFDSVVNGGTLSVGGDVRIDRFRSLIPNLAISASKVQMKMGASLAVMLSGEFFIRGKKEPYLFGGKCRLLRADLTKLDGAAAAAKSEEAAPLFNFNITCNAKDHLFVNTDVLKAEFRGNINVVGDNEHPGMLGSVEALTDRGHQGAIFFRDTRFDLDAAVARFESPEKIFPRFNASASTLVKEVKPLNPQQYQINLQVSGTPDSYRIRLSSSPALAENDIISLLVLGVTSRSTADSNGGAIDLSAAIAGNVPLQSMLQKELGVGISMTTQSQMNHPVNATPGASTVTTVQDYSTVPTVKIQKDITNRTKLSYSNTLDPQTPSRELKIEHVLDEHFSVNGTAADGPIRETGPSPANPSSPSYGIDFRYRFEFD